MPLNRWQISKQLVYLLKAATAGSPAVAVLGTALESTAPIEDYLASGLTFPIATVRTLASDADPNHPARSIVQPFTISVASSGTTDNRGPSAYPGSSGTASAQQSLEKAIKDLGAYLNGWAFVDTTHGFQGIVRSQGAARFVTGPEKWHAVADLEVEAFNQTTARSYHTAYRFKATASGGGAVALSWSLPPDRFDRLRVIVRRSAAGGSAPTSPTDGTAVTVTGGNLGTSATVTGLTAGQAYAFSIFVAYDETNSPPTTEEVYSAAVTASVTVT